MEQKKLRKLQLIQLEMLKEVKRICEKYRINYWLEGGTLLGAVRHGGFIPWDDDLDISMLRDDYERFLELAPGELDEMYMLETWHNTDEYCLPFAKLRKKGTVYKESVSAHTRINGIFIDIFPYDVYPKSVKDQKKQCRKIQLYRHSVLLKGGYCPWMSSGRFDKKTFVLYLPRMIVSIFFGKENTKLKFEKAHKSFNGSDDFTHYVVAGVTKYGKWKIRREFLDKLSEIQFEDDFFSCPSNCNACLTDLYGDYMKLPPEEKRGIGHAVLELDFGEK